METTVFEEESAYFEQVKPDLLKTNRGQYALIKGSKLFGTFTTMEEAYKEGVHQFGIQSFFIKQIEEKEFIHSIPALYAGLIGARI